MTKDEVILALLPLAIDENLVKGSSLMIQTHDMESNRNALSDLYGDIANALSDCDAVAQIVMYHLEQRDSGEFDAGYDQVDVKAIYEASMQRKMADY